MKAHAEIRYSIKKGIGSAVLVIAALLFLLGAATADDGSTYTITVIQGYGGTITPGGVNPPDTGKITVNEGDTIVFTIQPDVTNNCTIRDVKVDGISVGAVSSHAISNIYSDCTIEACFSGLPIFEPIQDPQNFTAGQNIKIFINAHDPDGGKVAFLPSSDPLILNASLSGTENKQLIIDWTPESTQVGTYMLYIQAIEASHMFDPPLERLKYARQIQFTLNIIAPDPPKPQYTVNINIDGDGEVSEIPGVGSHTYFEGTPITITAIPGEYRTLLWIGAPEGEELSQTISFNVASDMDIIAQFVELIPEYVSPDEVLIVANRDYYDRDGNGISDSVDVAVYYADKRGIPYGIEPNDTKNICVISCPKEEEVIDTVDKASLDKIIRDVRKYLDKNGGELKNKIYYIALAYGVPLKGRLDNTIYTRDYAGSLDWLLEKYLYGSIPDYKGVPNLSEIEANPIKFKSKEKYKRDNGKAPAYLVTRIDGYSAEAAKGLIDKAMYAERYVHPYPESNLSNPRGACVYIDQFGHQDGVINENNGFVQLSDYLKNLGIHVVNIEDIYPDASDIKYLYANTNKNFAAGQAPNTMYYWGWYKHFVYPRFDWVVGGVGSELHSFSALSLRMGRRATKAMLDEGVTGTMGWVYEPWGIGMNFQTCLVYFIEKGYDFAESMHMTDVNNSCTTRVGDPLYNIHKNIASKQRDIRLNDTVDPIISKVCASIKEEGVYFTWETDDVTWGQVEYATHPLLPDEHGTVVRDLFNIMYKTADYDPKYYSKRHGSDILHKVFIAKELMPNTVYYYRIRAIDPAGNEAISGNYTFGPLLDTIFYEEAWNPDIPNSGYHNNGERLMPGKSVRTYFGSDKFMDTGNYIRFLFAASPKSSLKIKKVTLSEASNCGYGYYFYNANTDVLAYQKSYLTGYINLAEGTKKSIQFNGSNELTLEAGATAWSDWVELPVQRNKNYILNYYVCPEGPGTAVTGALLGSDLVMSWISDGDRTGQADWASIISQETAAYEAIGNYTANPNYSITSGDSYVFNIEKIEVSQLNPQKRILAINKNGNGSVDPGTGSHTCNNGLSVSIRATPDNGYAFQNWVIEDTVSGTTASTSNPLTIVLDKNKTVTANFISANEDLPPPDNPVGDTTPPGDSSNGGSNEDQLLNLGNMGYVITDSSTAQTSQMNKNTGNEQPVAGPAEEVSQNADMPAQEELPEAAAGFSSLAEMDIDREQPSSIIMSAAAKLKSIATKDNKIRTPTKGALASKGSNTTSIVPAGLAAADINNRAVSAPKPKNEKPAAEQAIAPVIKVVPIKHILFWRTYKLDITVSGKPVNWKLGNGEKLPFGLMLNEKESTIFGLLFNKKEVNTKIIVTNKDNKTIEMPFTLKFD